MDLLCRTAMIIFTLHGPLTVVPDALILFGCTRVNSSDGRVRFAGCFDVETLAHF